VKPVHLVTPFGAGTGSDTVRRVLAAALSKYLGQPVVVDNRPGAGEVLAAQTVAKAAADGYTLLSATNAILFVKYIQPDIGYDPIADFAPVTTTSVAGQVLTVRTDSPAMRVEDLVALAKASPGKLNYGSGGMGSPPHLAAAAFQAVSGIKVMHVPFKGPTETPLAVLRGDVDYFFGAYGNIQPHLATGKMRALAVTNAARNTQLPRCRRCAKC